MDLESRVFVLEEKDKQKEKDIIELKNSNSNLTEAINKNTLAQEKTAVTLNVFTEDVKSLQQDLKKFIDEDNKKYKKLVTQTFLFIISGFIGGMLGYLFK